MKQDTSTKIYNTQKAVEKYYQMQYCPFLIDKAISCSTEPYYQEILSIIKPYLQTETRLLEIGCGLGRIIFESIKTSVAQATGVDISEAFIDECRRIAAGKSEYISYMHIPSTNLSFEVADAQKLPFVPGEFNFLISLNVIDRVPNPEDAIHELERLVLPGGLVLIADPYDWDEDYTEKEKHFTNMLDYFNDSNWEVLLEKNIPFNLQVNERKLISYSDHVLLLKRK